MSAELGVSGETATPQERVTALMGRAFELRQVGNHEEAIQKLEQALTAARATPYEIEFQTRIQLTMTLADVYQATGQIHKAKEMLTAEAEFAEKISQIMQATGSPSQKRSAMSGYLQVRDRATQMALIDQQAPEIRVKEWIQGGPASLAHLRGRVVLLEFWATWCKPCQEMFPKLNRLSNEHKQKGLEVVGLTRHYLAYGGPAESMLEERQLMQNMITEHGVNYHVGIAEDEHLQSAFGANGLPTVVLIDRAGVVRFVGPGEEGEVFEKALKQCLDASA